MSLFQFFRKAPEFMEPDADALEQAGADHRRQSAYHKRIVKIALAFGILGVVAGGALAIYAPFAPHADRDRRVIVMAPFLAGVAGAYFGSTAVACLFAPHDFPAGPLGRKWMKLIGTESVLVARIVCGLLGLVGLLPVVAIIHDLMKGKL